MADRLSHADHQDAHHVTALTREEAAARAALVAAVDYEVHLDLRASEGDTFTSTSTVRFGCTTPGASTFVDLEAAEVRSVTLNGRELRDVVAGDRIRLDDLAGHNELVVRAECRYQTTGVGLHRFVDPADQATYVHTQFEPYEAHKVYACFDQPDLKAPFTLQVDAPAEWEVVGNGRCIERPEAGQSGRWRFAATLPISPYITALVAGPLHVVRDAHRGIDLGLYCRRSLAQHLDADEMLTITKQGFDLFTELFAFPYPFGKYDQLFVPEFNWGAMENPGCVTFSESYIFRSKVTDAAREQRANTTLHEMAHMWFGDLVTMRWWDDLWLNESFATFSATHALVAATRFTDAWATFADEDKAWAIAQDQLPSTHPISADITDTDAVATHFDGITYAKGASVLRQLVAWVGEEAFFSGLRRYFRAHSLDNASLADFLSHLEQASGRDLRTWAEQWLQTAGVSVIRLQLPDGDVLDGTTIVQTADDAHPTLRDHRVAIGAYTMDGDGVLERTGRVELDVTGETTPVPGLTGARPDLLLVNDGDLAFTKIRLDERSIATLTRALSTLADPLARSVAWGALWDMVRDAEVPARTFVSTVARHAGSERSIGVLQTLLARATSAVDRYGAVDNRLPARTTLRDAAVGGIAASKPGGDEQLVWVRLRAQVAPTDADLDWVAGLLEGHVEVDGLAVDTDLRWTLLTALAAAGRAGPDDIAAEHERDATDLGARRAAAARAARPDPAAKRAAWDEAVHGGTSMTQRLAAMGGFHQVDQPDLMAPYVAEYGRVVPVLWDGRGIEESMRLTSALYPRTVVASEVLEMARGLLDGDLPATARRIVSEQADATARALRARRVDTPDVADTARATPGA